MLLRFVPPPILHPIERLNQDLPIAANDGELLSQLSLCRKLEREPLAQLLPPDSRERGLERLERLVRIDELPAERGDGRGVFGLVARLERGQLGRQRGVLAPAGDKVVLEVALWATEVVSVVWFD